MILQDEIQVREELLSEWYSEDEIKKIIQGHKEILDWKWISAEEAFKILMKKELDYA